jgi:hypothetical protein
MSSAPFSLLSKVSILGQGLGPELPNPCTFRPKNHFTFTRQALFCCSSPVRSYKSEEILVLKRTLNKSRAIRRQRARQLVPELEIDRLLLTVNKLREVPSHARQPAALPATPPPAPRPKPLPRTYS